ncbi:hypothetical protein EV141_0502 [Microcella putealis]|uniref:Uncharacterized protein n=1 Tax=Microcella putealis TaxID=337005 RepID=A0A4Q7LXW8_9MICO|nr:hypothetical protein [Microcella putealis]RZS59282.1 hypothetical protein EV141_0502 [Microcella putealis]TQM19907.1 hypothetical protein BJ957_2039 [Microcella putealis]
MSMDHPSVNAPSWSFWRLFSTISLLGSAFWTLGRPLLAASDPEQRRQLAEFTGLTIGVVAIAVIGVLLAGGVRMGLAEATRLAAAPDAVRCATASFTPTRMGMRALATRYGLPPKRGFALSWGLVEVDETGIAIRRAHEDADVVLHVPAHRIRSIRLGAMTDGMLRVPTMNVEVGPDDDSVVLPIGLLAGPTKALPLIERELFIASARRLLRLDVAR